MGTFKNVFGKLGDPRASNRQHELLEVLFIAFAAILCGAEGAADMARFGHAKEGLLRRFLPLEHGIPSHDTFSRVFRLLEPVAFEGQFLKFVREIGPRDRVAVWAMTDTLRRLQDFTNDARQLAAAVEHYTPNLFLNPNLRAPAAETGREKERRFR